MKASVAFLVALALSLFGVHPVLSMSCGNSYVTVSSSTLGVEGIYAVNDDFYVTTRDVSSPPFEADIKVAAHKPWYLKYPRPGQLSQWGHLQLGIGENDAYWVGDGASSEEGPGGIIYVLKLDIEPEETNVCWKSTSCTLRLTGDSFPGGNAVWSSVPAGISGTGRSVTFNPSSLRLGEYTVKAMSGVVPTYLDACIVTIDPSIAVADICIQSPAQNHLWPYDPVWHDPDWALSVNGAKAVQCATDVDDASISYTLNKKAQAVEIYLYKDVFGPINQLVQLTGGTKKKGVNLIPRWWKISSEDNGDYFAKVMVSGCHDDEISRAESSMCKIERRDYFTANLLDTVESVGVWRIWKHTRTVADLLASSAGTVVLTLGNYYLIPAGLTILEAVGLSLVENVGAYLMFGSAVPDWIGDGNSVYVYRPWSVTQYWWDPDTAEYVTGDPGIGVESTWNVSCSEVFHSSIATPPPTSGATPLCVQFHNHYTDAAFSEEEMKKTPWSEGLNNNAYGLKAPQLIPVSSQGGE